MADKCGLCGSTEYKTVSTELTSCKICANCGEEVLTTPFRTILEDALKYTQQDRQGDYGHPLEDFTKTAVLLLPILDVVVPIERIPLMMIAVKTAREINKHKRDNPTDTAGYSNTLEMLYERIEVLGLNGKVPSGDFLNEFVLAMTRVHELMKMTRGKVE